MRSNAKPIWRRMSDFTIHMPRSDSAVPVNSFSCRWLGQVAARYADTPASQKTRLPGTLVSKPRRVSARISDSWCVISVDSTIGEWTPRRSEWLNCHRLAGTEVTDPAIPKFA